MAQTNPGFFLDNKSPEKQKTAVAQRNTRTAILFLVSAAYGLFIFFIIKLGMQGYQNLFLLALYIYGVVGGLGFLLVNQFYTSIDRSRKVLIEVLENSAEARVITDSDGDTIYSNLRFNLYHLLNRNNKS